MGWRPRRLRHDAPPPRPSPAAIQAARGETGVSALDVADCIDEPCPRPGRPVRADPPTGYGGEVVGFRNPGCRGRFERAIRRFEEAKAPQGRAAS